MTNCAQKNEHHLLLLLPLLLGILLLLQHQLVTMVVQPLLSIRSQHEAHHHAQVLLGLREFEKGSVNQW